MPVICIAVKLFVPPLYPNLNFLSLLGAVGDNVDPGEWLSQALGGDCEASLKRKEKGLEANQMLMKLCSSSS